MNGSEPRRTVGLAAVLLSLLLGSACTPKPTDTGLVGTWKHDGSLISIRRADDGYHFRWSKSEPQVVRCSRDDFCEEFKDDKKIFEHRFRLYEKEGYPGVFKEVRITSVPDDGKPIRYLDLLSVEAGGMRLVSRMVEVGGEPVEDVPPPFYFDKLSDEPF